VPKIIDYPDVLCRMTEAGFRSLYHNSGAFGFAADSSPHVVGWIGADDPTIRAEAMSRAQRVPPPYEQNLSALLVRAWQEGLPGPLWLMPASHWSYELEFGNFDWLPAALRQLAIDPASLQSRNNGAAIEFAPHESSYAGQFAKTLLELLHGSDFTVAFPGQPVICTLHHHKQLWWQTSDDAIAVAIRQFPV